MDFYRKPGSTALAYLVAGAVWFVVGTLYGGVSALHLVSPELWNNIAALTFGRERPIHVNSVLYGFVTTTLIGVGLHYVPALLRTRLWSEPLGWVSFVLWNLTMISAPITFSYGWSQGREYAEHLWWFDVSLTLSLVLMLVNVVMTIAQRQENALYVSVWYFTGMLLWMCGVYPIGNCMWNPKWGAMQGLIDSVFLWYYGHNLPGLLLTPLAVGAALYVVPRVARTPLYSHTLSLIGFWTLVVFYTHIGGHHILQAPIPNWLKVMSVTDSVAMVIPVFVAIANIWLTARGYGGRLLADPAGRFVITGIAWYLIVCIQGPFQSLPFVQVVTHFNNWTIGHSHIAVLGFAGFIALGGMWHVLPLITHRKIYSDNLINLQYGLVMFGLIGFFVVLTIAGLIQGSAWYNGEDEYRVLPTMAPYMAARVFSGVFIILGAFVGLYNLLMTIKRGERWEPARDIQEDRA